MRSKLTIIDDAGDLSLLTADELRAAIGVTGSSNDVALKALGLRIAAIITSECGVAVGIGAEPTLKQETVEEVIRRPRTSEIILARRHNIEIVSVDMDGTTALEADYDVDPEAGILARYSSSLAIDWCASLVTVRYKAGFEEIPQDLRQAAMDFVRLAWAEKDRDPSLKSEVVDIPDVRRVERGFWVGSVPGQSFEGAVPDIVAGQLKRFRNYAVG